MSERDRSADSHPIQDSERFRRARDLIRQAFEHGDRVVPIQDSEPLPEMMENGAEFADYDLEARGREGDGTEPVG